MRIAFTLIAVLALQTTAFGQQCATGNCANPFGVALPASRPLRAALSLPAARLGEVFMSGDFTPRQGLVTRVRENRAERKAARAVK